MGNTCGEQGDQSGAKCANTDTTGDPERAADDANRGGHYNAYDERCFQYLSEDDDCDCEHGASTSDKVSTGRRIEVVEKVVCARPERSHIDDDLFTGRDDFLATQLETFELGRGGAFVLHVQLDLLSGGHTQFRRNELVVLKIEIGNVGFCACAPPGNKRIRPAASPAKRPRPWPA